MKYIVFLLLFAVNSYANDLRIKINPAQPILNETFSIDFIIETEAEGEPIINFNPLGVEVVDRGEMSTSTRFTSINGVNKIERSITVTYELMPTKVGSAFIRDIEVEVGDKVLKHKTVRINVLKKAKAQKKIFVKAEVSKEKVYVGESIVVRYYLYSRTDVNITSYDVTKFPKLDKFLKRFHQEQGGPERVSINNQVFVRRIMYTAQLFGESKGIYKVDPITLRVGYSNRNNPFGGFGGFNLQLRRPMKTTVVSPPVEIDIVDLPVEGMPSHFSGLVGKHEFSLKLNRNKFIANEPIEIQLLVDGDGALELFEAPSLIDHQEVEELEKNADLTVRKNFSAQKKVDYTYLGRNSVSLENIEVPISYFDPETEEYITKTLSVGNIKIAGMGQSRTSNKPEKTKPITENTNTTPVIEDKSIFEFRPILKLANTYIYNAKEIMMVFIGLTLFLIIYLFIRLFKNRTVKDRDIFEEVEKEGINYSNLFKILSLSGIDGNMETIVDELNLSNDANKYYKELINSLNSQFATEQEGLKTKINKKFLKELEKKIIDDQL